jgi:hypothetical protein
MFARGARRAVDFRNTSGMTTGEAMRIVHLYWLLVVVGAAVPLAAFVPWVAAHGLDVPRFLTDLFANRVSAFFGLDVIVSAIVLVLFVLTEGRRIGAKALALPILATFLVGVSCGLPLFLALREQAIDRGA